LRLRGEVDGAYTEERWKGVQGWKVDCLDWMASGCQDAHAQGRVFHHVDVVKLLVEYLGGGCSF
jgi:hypothetical protein